MPATPSTRSSVREVSSLPPSRPSRAVVEVVGPVVDGGAFPAKATIGEPVTVTADVFVDGHDRAAAALRSRSAGRGRWAEVPMEALGNDRFAATFVPDRLGPWQFQVVGWLDHLGTWLHGMELKLAAPPEMNVDVGVDLQIGSALVAAAVEHARGDDRAALIALGDALDRGDTRALGHLPDDVSERPGQEPAGGPEWASERAETAAPHDDGHVPDLQDVEPEGGAAELLEPLFWRNGPRDPTATSPTYDLHVDRERARFSAWYELFPRSTVAPATGHGTLADVIERLDHVAAMGFDVLYLPPVHPIGRTQRKGRNNTITSSSDDTGSPWAIGGVEGGHTAVHPQLGTVDDVAKLADACQQRGLELAMDIAFQCTPDHPWVIEHPDWFAHRPDGSIQYAENPPKKYQDIYPLDFESADWRSLWEGVADVFRFWIDVGVSIFRVDNPHTKAFAFWQWAIATIRAEHPEAIFLAEAFTRPRVMERLAKLGFNQSYTYFTWRQSSWELRQYFEDLMARTVDYFRPNAWPNTPDILTAQLQTGGRGMFASRAALAATLSPSWGVYGPAFELGEHTPVRPGSEEYLDSEKYQLRQWDLDRADTLAPLLTRLNEIRRAQPALAHLRTLHFHEAANPALLCYSKTDPAGAGSPILVVANLDATQRQQGFVDVDLEPLGLRYESDYDLQDQLTGATFRWQGAWNFVDLDPSVTPMHIFIVHGTDS